MKTTVSLHSKQPANYFLQTSLMFKLGLLTIKNKFNS